MDAKKKFLFPFLTIVTLLVLSCDDPVNPFLETTQAKASVYSKSFTNKDTVLIFSRESLSIVIYLKEHVHQVALHIDHNRLWSLQDTTLDLQSYSGDPITMPFSFYDTGWQHIEIKTLLNNGSFSSEQYALYVRTPLFQKSIRGSAGDTITLQTDSVSDSQILYVWDFHDGMVVKENTAKTTIILKNTPTSSTGALYVSDSRYRSPSVAFSIEKNIAPPLTLVSLNDSVSGDTVFSDDATFLFSVAVVGTVQLKSASINGMPFDNMQIKTGSVQISKTFGGLDTVRGSLTAEVEITDATNRSVEKSFIIRYDSTIIAVPPEITLRLPVTVYDTGYVNLSPLSLLGSVTGTITSDHVYLQVIANGKPRGACKVLRDNTAWAFPIHLDTGWNTIQLELTPDSLLQFSILAATEIHLAYQPEISDNTPPVINDINIDGYPLPTTRHIVSNYQSVFISVLASDNSKVTSVTINGTEATPDSNQMTFNSTLTLSHSKAGKSFVVCATDQAGNKAFDTLTGAWNRSPSITSITFPSILIADSVHRFAVHAIDPDSDAIVITATLKSATVDTILTFINGTACWRPSVADTGVIAVQVHASDSLFKSFQTSLSIRVFQHKAPAVPVAFLTAQNDFPDTLITGGAPLSLRLKVDSLTGTGQLTYLVYRGNPAVKLYEGTSPSIIWKPTRAETGLQSFRVMVRDSLGYSDTIDLLITVVANPAAIIQIVEPTLNVTEGDSSGSVTLKLSAPLTDSFTVRYRVTFSTALHTDIAFDTAGSIAIGPGETVAKLPIKIIDDTYIEPEEKFSITLSALPPLSARDSIIVDKQNTTCIITITDNDNASARVGVMLQPGSIPDVPEVAYIGTYPAIVLTEALPVDLTVTVKQAPTSTAHQGTDYTITSEKIIVKAGQTVSSLGLLLVNDRIHESTETIILEITTISNTGIAFITDQKTSRITVTDDD